MKLLNTYLKYDGKITEEQFNQCIEIVRSLGYKVIDHSHLKTNYAWFTRNDGKYFRFGDGYGGHNKDACVDNNPQRCDTEVTLQDILNCKQSITFNYLIL